MLGEYITSLLAPWRRINRAEFVAAMTILSLPGLVLMAMGLMSGTSGLMSGFQSLSHLAQGGSVGGIEQALNMARDTAVPTTSAAPLMNIPALINAFCLFLLYPFVRGRLLDMGYALRTATLLAILVQISTLNDILAALVCASRGPLPMGWAFGLLTFVAYIWLTLAGSRARKAYDRGPSKHSQLDDDFPPPEHPHHEVRPPDLTRNPLAGVCICVDGPTASGKGTLAKSLARHWRLKFLDTGALYRAVAYVVLQRGHEPADNSAALAAATHLAQSGVFDFKHLGNNDFGIFIAGVNVGASLRSLEVGQASSIVAIQPPVRAALLGLQQTFVQHWQPLVGVVLDGRDTAARIAPHAQVKIFLTAEVAERGRRRWLEVQAHGQETDLDAVIAQVAARDARDRDNLLQTADAVVIDGTAISAAEVLRVAIAACEERLGRQVSAAPQGA